MNVLVIVALAVLIPVAFATGTLYGPTLRDHLTHLTHRAPAVPDPTLIAPPLPPIDVTRAAMNTAVIPAQRGGPAAELPSTGRHFPENRNETSELINVDELHKMLADDTGPIRLVGPSQG